MGTRTRQTATDSPKAEVGEIDTKAPFESVRAAVSLFGKVALSAHRLAAKKTKPPGTESTSADTVLPEKEMNKLNKQLSNAEKQLSDADKQFSDAETIEALAKLDIAKRTVDELTQKLNAVNESKEAALKVIQAAKYQTKELEEVNFNNDNFKNEELETTREHYEVVMQELDAAKQELVQIKNDFEACVDAKVSASEQEAKAMHLYGTNNERAAQLYKEIAEAQESLVHAKLANEQAQKGKSRIVDEKDAKQENHKQMLAETEEKLASLKKEFDPGMYEDLETKLAKATTEIGTVEKEIDAIKATDSELVSTVTVELDGKKELVQKLAEEKSSLDNLVESLKQELEAVKGEHSKVKEKHAETESIAANLNAELQIYKLELEEAMGSKFSVTEASDKLVSALQQLTVESETAQEQAEAMMKDAEEIRNETEQAHIVLGEAQDELHSALKDAVAVKALELSVLDQVESLSEKANAGTSTLTTEQEANVTISADESEKLGEMKVTDTSARVSSALAEDVPVMEKNDEFQHVSSKGHGAKKAFLPGLSSIFFKKKAHANSGSQSDHPGEKPE